MYYCGDATARDQLTFVNAGTDTPIKYWLDWMADNYPDVYAFVEAGLLSADNDTILSAYPPVGTVTAFNLVFDDNAFDGTPGSLVVDNVDPATYPDKVHIVYVASNTVGWVGEVNADDAAVVERLTVTCELLAAETDVDFAVASTIRYLLNSNLDQQARLNAAAAFDVDDPTAPPGLGTGSQGPASGSQRRLGRMGRLPRLYRF
jgi:hypothetical protein